MDSNTTTTIEDVNREAVIVMRPTFILISILMPIGILGNATALYIYGFRFQKLPVHIFLISLGVFDMIGCIFGIPLEMVALWYPKMYPHPLFCKLEKFLIFYSSITSTLTLFVIALERFRKVCRHNNKQLSVREAKIIAVMIGVLSIGMASPGALFFDKITQQISLNVEAQVCFYIFGYNQLQIYFLVSLVFDFIILTTMFLLYHRIWKVAKEHYTPANYMVNMNLNNVNAQQQTLKAYTKIRQTNKILVCITLLFAISFIPGLILGVTYPLYEDVKLPVVVESLRQMVFRMWIFNCTMNPIVYGFLNMRFRRIVLSIFSKLVCRTSHDNNSVGSSDALR